MTITTQHSARLEFARTIGRLGITAGATSALAMLYKLAMPRVLGRSELAELYFAETFPFLFFGIIPLGISNYIAKELAGNLPRVRETLASILGFEACAGIMAYVLLLGTAASQIDQNHHELGIIATMGIACFAIVVQQRIFRPLFIALDAAQFISRLEITARIILASSLLISLAVFPNLQWIVTLHALVEVSTMAIYTWSAWQRGWLEKPMSLTTTLQILKASLPFSAVVIMLAINGNVDSTLFRILTDQYEMGLYAATNRIGLIVLFGVTVIFSSVLPMLGRIARRSPQEYLAILSGMMRLTCTVGLPLTIIFTMIARILTDIILGSEFVAAWRGLSIYGTYMLVVAINLLVSSHLSLRAKPRVFAYAMGCSLILNIITASLGIFLATKYLGEGSTSVARLLAGIVSETISMMIFLKLGQHELDGSRLLNQVIFAVFPALTIAAIQWSGYLNSWLERSIILLILPAYMLSVGLLKRGDSLSIIRLAREILMKNPQRSPHAA